MLADIWQWTPFMVLIFLAGLRSLPPEPYEAAMLDGASAIQTLLAHHRAPDVKGDCRRGADSRHRSVPDIRLRLRHDLRRARHRHLYRQPLRLAANLQLHQMGLRGDHFPRHAGADPGDREPLHMAREGAVVMVRSNSTRVLRILSGLGGCPVVRLPAVLLGDGGVQGRQGDFRHAAQRLDLLHRR